MSETALAWLDSASLRHGNGYGHSFAKPGRYRYALVPALGRHLARMDGFEIEVVKEGVGSGPSQLGIAVSLRDGHLAATPAKAQVPAGTTVFWTAESPSVLPYAVIAEDDSFSSDRLKSRSIFTCLVPHDGICRWIDRHGSGFAGEIRVAGPDASDAAQLAQWQMHLHRPALVTIRGPKVARAQATIGQSLVFVVEKAPGITITDRRLLTGHDDSARGG